MKEIGTDLTDKEMELSVSYKEIDIKDQLKII